MGLAQDLKKSYLLREALAALPIEVLDTLSYDSQASKFVDALMKAPITHEQHEPHVQHAKLRQLWDKKLLIPPPSPEPSSSEESLSEMTEEGQVNFTKV